MRVSSWVLAVGLVSCTPSSPEIEERPVLAMVSGVPIYVDEYEARLRRMQFGDEDGLPSVTGERAQRQALLDDLIERHLLLHEAEKHNVVVGMDEVDALYQRTRSGWLDEDANSECSQCSFEEALENMGMTPAAVKLDLRNDLMIRKYYRDHVFSRVAVTDQEIDELIVAHPERREAPEEVRAQMLVVKTEDQAQRILQEIKRGLSFEEAAMKYSLSQTGKVGGDLGYFSRGSMPEVFDEVCFSLRPGTVSKVVASDYGFHLFKVTSVRPQRELPLPQIREMIESELRRQKEHAAQQVKIEELRRAAQITVEEDILAQIH